MSKRWKLRSNEMSTLTAISRKYLSLAFSRKLFRYSSTRSSGLNCLSFILWRIFDVYDKTCFRGIVRQQASRRKALAWVVATWVVINCDKAQTRHTRNMCLPFSLSLISSRTRQTMCVGAPAYEMYIHACTRVRARVRSADYGLHVRACAWARRRSLTLAGSRLENSVVAHELPRRVCNLEPEGRSISRGTRG